MLGNKVYQKIGDEIDNLTDIYMSSYTRIDPNYITDLKPDSKGIKIKLIQKIKSILELLNKLEV